MIVVKRIISIWLLLLFSAACDDTNNSSEDADTDTNEHATDSDPPQPIELNGDWVTSITPLREIPQADATSAFTLLQLQIPDGAALVDKVQYDVSVYKMVYQTQYLDNTVSASALVAIPQTDTPVPTLSFQNGTSTEYAAAPTEDFDGLFMNIITSVASVGYVVTVADYLGFGESTQLFHPYLCKDVTSQSLSDMLLGVMELDTMNDVEFSLKGELFIAGYSQGGHATMSLHEHLTTLQNFPFSLAATAAGAAPYDLETINDYILSLSQYEQPYYAPYTVLAFQSMGFIPNDLSLYFASDYVDIIPTLFDGQTASEDISAALTTDVQSLYSEDYLDGLYTDSAYEPMLTAFAYNSIAPFESATPIRLYHGAADTYVPTDISLDLQNTLFDAGTPESLVEYIELPDADHETAAPSAIVDAVIWFNAINEY